MLEIVRRHIESALPEARTAAREVVSRWSCPRFNETSRCHGDLNDRGDGFLEENVYEEIRICCGRRGVAVVRRIGRVGGEPHVEPFGRFGGGQRYARPVRRAAKVDLEGYQPSRDEPERAVGLQRGGRYHDSGRGQHPSAATPGRARRARGEAVSLRDAA